jgi:hypothetical protein
VVPVPLVWEVPLDALAASSKVQHVLNSKTLNLWNSCN